MSRGDVSVGMLVSIAALMAFLVVTLVIVWPVIKEALFGAGEEGSCQFSLLLSAYAKKFTVGSISLEPECKVKRKVIGLDDINMNMAQATAVVDAIPDGAQVRADPLAFEFITTGWALNKVVADEMYQCFNRGWRGKQDISGTDIGTAVVNVIKDENRDFFCLLCSTLSYDAGLKSAMNDLQNRLIARDELFSVLGYNTAKLRLKSWMERNSPKAEKEKTYYSILTEGVDPFFQRRVDEATIDLNKRQAVLFVARAFKGEVGYGLNFEGGVVLADYETITSDLGWTFARERCAVIIGD